jgi:hypothetical protein
MMKKRAANVDFNELLDTLVEMLKAMKRGVLSHMDHKVETGEHFERRTFESTTLDRAHNQSVKIVVHRWWGDRP